jgi:hypothetical protein
MPESGRPRRSSRAWVEIGFLVLGSLGCLYYVQRGNIGLAGLLAGAAVFSAWRVRLRHRFKQRPPDWTQVTTMGLQFHIGSGIVILGIAVLATISADRASGGDRILWAVGAGVLYVLVTDQVLSAIAVYRYRSGRRIGRLAWMYPLALRRGCTYCADDSNMDSAHLDQLAGNEARQMVLVKCPTCGWLYVISLHKPRDAIHVTGGQADLWFMFPN